MSAIRRARSENPFSQKFAHLYNVIAQSTEGSMGQRAIGEPHIPPRLCSPEAAQPRGSIKPNFRMFFLIVIDRPGP